MGKKLQDIRVWPLTCKQAPSAAQSLQSHWLKGYQVTITHVTAFQHICTGISSDTSGGFSHWGLKVTWNR